MANQKKTDYVPTIKDLEKLVQSCSPRYTDDEPKSSQLQSAYDSLILAKDAFEEFCDTNPEYKKLLAAKEKAGDRYSTLSGRERENKKKAVRDCYNSIRLHGNAPHVIKMVEKLVKRYDPPREILE